MKAILVTGGAGFIGSNLIELLLKKYSNYLIVNLDKLTYAADLKNLKAVKNASNYKFVKGDICDRNLVENIFRTNKITGVFHLAAESHVDNSIVNPDVFIETNVKGTFTLLDVAYKYWMKNPFTFKKDFENSRFLHVSTDEVYGSLGKTGYFTEKSPYAPNSPYSASKASSDMLVRSYFHTYGLQVFTTNCSNNYGKYQHKEKLIPAIIRKGLAGEDIPIYGDGSNIRDWLYVKDHCNALDLVFHEGTFGEVYNIGGENEKNNNQIVTEICEILKKKIPFKDFRSLITHVKDRAGHDFRYAINASKIKNELGWKAEHNFSINLERTVDWYINKYGNE